MKRCSPYIMLNGYRIIMRKKEVLFGFYAVLNSSSWLGLVRCSRLWLNYTLSTMQSTISCTCMWTDTDAEFAKNAVAVGLSIDFFWWWLNAVLLVLLSSSYLSVVTWNIYKVLMSVSLCRLVCTIIFVIICDSFKKTIRSWFGSRFIHDLVLTSSRLVLDLSSLLNSTKIALEC